MRIMVDKETCTCECPRCHGLLTVAIMDEKKFECLDCGYEFPVIFDSNGDPDYVVVDDDSEEQYLEQLEEDEEYEEAYWRDQIMEYENDKQFEG